MCMLLKAVQIGKDNKSESFVQKHFIFIKQKRTMFNLWSPC